VEQLGDHPGRLKLNFNENTQEMLPGTSNGAGAAEPSTPEATPEPARGRKHRQLTPREPVQ